MTKTSDSNGTGDVPTRYCNQCGQEEHGTAGCETHFYEAIIVPAQRFWFIVGIPYGLVDALFPAEYRLIGGEVFRRDFVNLPPGAKPFRLPKR